MNITSLNNPTRQLTLLALLLSSFIVQGQVNRSSNLNSPEKLDSLLNQAEILKFSNPERAIFLLQECKSHYLNMQDTMGVIISLARLSNLYAHVADYNKSYDGYWEALILAEKLENESAKASIYNGLGWLYSFFNRKNKSIEYFNKSIEINRELVRQNPQKSQLLLDDYYALATLFRKEGNLNLARVYIDSCKYVRSRFEAESSNSIFLEAELGYILTKERKYIEAQKKLLAVKPFFEEADSTYLIILYPFLGEIYKNTDDLNLSAMYYQEALGISERFKSHLDLIPKIYEDLSEVYFLQGEHEKAYLGMEEAKKLNEIQFGSRSAHNQRLLEIKDDFRVEMERQDKLIQEQRLGFLEQQHKISQLQTFILIGAILFLIILGFLIYRFLRSKYKAEKKYLRKKQQLEIQKTEEVLMVKNKELTTSTLQAIEKEELLKETKEELIKQKKNPNPTEIGKIIKRIEHSVQLSWEEFELRFMAVNQGFYEKLKTQFPNLSQNDHKTCALIKLNFSSKDIAKLLGISVESVHTSRYRIRKKMNLSRSINLEDYIAKM